MLSRPADNIWAGNSNIWAQSWMSQVSLGTQWLRAKHVALLKWPLSFSFSRTRHVCALAHQQPRHAPLNELARVALARHAQIVSLQKTTWRLQPASALLHYRKTEWIAPLDPLLESNRAQKQFNGKLDSRLEVSLSKRLTLLLWWLLADWKISVLSVLLPFALLGCAAYKSALV